MARARKARASLQRRPYMHAYVTFHASAPPRGTAGESGRTSRQRARLLLQPMCACNGATRAVLPAVMHLSICPAVLCMYVCTHIHMYMCIFPTTSECRSTYIQVNRVGSCRAIICRGPLELTHPTAAACLFSPPRANMSAACTYCTPCVCARAVAAATATRVLEPPFSSVGVDGAASLLCCLLAPAPPFVAAVAGITGREGHTTPCTHGLDTRV